MAREILPARRRADTFEFEAGVPGYSTAHFVATVGFYSDGRPGELFVHPQKTGSDRDLTLQAAAISISFALQYGASIDDLRRAMPRTALGEPEEPIGTLLDLLAKSSAKEEAA